MPKVSKESASQGGDHGLVVEHSEDLEGYTVNFLTFREDIDHRPLLRGLPGDQCQCPHWGFVVRGQVTTTDAAGVKETVKANDLFYWPPGHNVKVNDDAEIGMFSPQHEHSQVINHMIAKVAS